MSIKPTTGTSKKRAGGTKHHGGKSATAKKHHPQHQPAQAHQGGKHAAPAHGKSPRRGLPLLANGVCCCTPEALAESLRMAGWPAERGDMLELYFAMTDDPNAGVSIPAALEAASKFGVAGVKPVSWAQIPNELWQPGDIEGWLMDNGDRHSVALTRSGMISWGEHWMPDTLPRTVEETWTIRWPR